MTPAIITFFLDLAWIKKMTAKPHWGPRRRVQFN